MIAADRNMLKASLTRGILEIQLNLVNLYTSNLNAIATQAALVAGFSFTGIAETTYPGHGVVPLTLGYFYYFFDTLCLVSGLFAVSQATIVTLYGPAMALSGETPEAVTRSVVLMRDQQDFVFKVGGVSITSLFLAACFLSWAKLPYGVALVNTCVYAVVYYLMATEGRKAYRMFHTDNDASVFTGKAPSAASKDVSPAAGGVTMGEAAIQEALQLKARGVIWMRMSLSKGGQLQECYGVLDKGRFDVYRNENDFMNHSNPINKSPIKLWQYTLETDMRNFANNTAASLTGALRGAIMGQSEFSFATLAASEYDLKEAAKKYKFALCPKVSSELTALNVVELMAGDEQSYKLWIKALSKVINAYEEIAANPTVEATMKATTNVEMVVQAANR